MKVLYLHLTGGKTLGFLLPEAEARSVVDAIRGHWHTPDEGARDIGVGSGEEITAWLQYAHITGIELQPEQAVGEV